MNNKSGARTNSKPKPDKRLLIAKNIKTILVVCSGNICRSPMAHGYLEKCLKDKGLDNIRVRSAGTLGFSGNPASRESVLVGKSHGFDIRGHLSTGLTRELAREASVIFVMSFDHKRETIDKYKIDSDKIFLLGKLCDDPDIGEIMDPIGMGQETYFQVFEDIKKCVDSLVNRIEENSK